LGEGAAHAAGGIEDEEHVDRLAGRGAGRTSLTGKREYHT
jgi:hypothetical protein